MKKCYHEKIQINEGCANLGLEFTVCHFYLILDQKVKIVEKQRNAIRQRPTL